MSERIQKIVVCGIVHRNGKVLVAKRAATKKFLPDHWELPGGHVEFGETLEEALDREVNEELHLEIIIGPLFEAFTYTTPDNSTHEVEVCFFATLRDTKQEPQLNIEDHSEYKWITLEEAETLLDPNALETPIIKEALVNLGTQQ